VADDDGLDDADGGVDGARVLGKLCGVETVGDDVPGVGLVEEAKSGGRL
jgi:hypothetical protein